MSTVKFKCPGCGAVNEGDAAVMGTTVECAGCKAPLEVPAPAPAPQKPLMAELMDAPDEAPSPPAEQVGEGDLFILHPMGRGFGTAMSMMSLFGVGTLAALIWAWQKDFSLLWALVPFAAFLYAGWRVFYQTRSVTYRLSSHRLFIQVGLIGRSQEEIELFRITDVSMEQTAMERLMGIGTIVVKSTDETLPVAKLENISDPVKHKDILRDAYRSARTREGMRAGEFIGSGV